MKNLRVRFLLWLREKVSKWQAKYDKCYLCSEQADYWCESCDRRHCVMHESYRYEDVNCCDVCAEALEKDGE